MIAEGKANMAIEDHLPLNSSHQLRQRDAKCHGENL
jgi:hypothetical protein